MASDEKDAVIAQLGALQNTINTLQFTQDLDPRRRLQAEFDALVRAIADANILGPVRAGIELPRPVA